MLNPWPDLWPLLKHLKCGFWDQMTPLFSTYTLNVLWGFKYLFVNADFIQIRDFQCYRLKITTRQHKLELIILWVSHVFQDVSSDVETNIQTDPRGQKNTRSPPSCGWPNKRKRETASPWRPALRRVYRELGGQGQLTCVSIPEAWPNCPPAGWLCCLRSVHSHPLRVFKKHGG